MIPPTQCCSHKPFVLSSWFDKLTTIGFFPNVLSEIEGQAQGERFFAFYRDREGGIWSPVSIQLWTD